MNKLILILAMVVTACGMDADPRTDGSEEFDRMSDEVYRNQVSASPLPEVLEALEKVTGGPVADLWCGPGGTQCCSVPMAAPESDEPDKGIRCCCSISTGCWCGECVTSDNGGTTNCGLQEEPSFQLDEVHEARAVQALVGAPKPNTVTCPGLPYGFCTFFSQWICETICNGPSYCQLTQDDGHGGYCVSLTAPK